MCIQVNGIAMVSPLAPLLTDIFMIELERSLIPNLSKKVLETMSITPFIFSKLGRLNTYISVE